MTLALCLRRNLVHFRLTHRLTQQAAADALEVKQSRYAAWEQGYAEPKVSHLVRLGQLYGCPLEAFIVPRRAKRQRRGRPAHRPG